MNHCIAALKGGRCGLAVGDVADHVVADVGTDLLGAGGQALGSADQEADLVAGALCGLGGPRTHEPRTAGDQYLHVSSRCRCDGTLPGAVTTSDGRTGIGWIEWNRNRQTRR